MANARAIASGNWSATSTWNGGVLPGNGDTVYANGFTVTIDQNVTIGGANNPTVNAGSFVSGQWYEITSGGSTSFTGIGAAANTVGTIFQASGVGSGTGQARARATLTTATNTAAGATNSGGGFSMSGNYTINANIRAGSTICLSISGSSTSTISTEIISAGTNNGINISGTANVTINSATISTASNSNAHGIFVGVGCNLNINNCFVSSNSGVYAYGISNSGTVTSNGSTFIGYGNGYASGFNNGNGVLVFNNGTINGGSGVSYGITNANGSINISNSTVTGGSPSGAFAIQVTGTGVVSLTNTTVSAASSIAISSTSSVSVIGDIFASTSATAISATGLVTVSGSIISAINGMFPISASRIYVNPVPVNAKIRFSKDGSQYFDFFTADSVLGQANPTDVRSGVSYASGYLTGRLTVPARGSVALSVNYGPSMPFAATRSGTTATATLAYSYPLVVGDQITVTGASNSEWNSTYTIASVVSGTSVTFDVPNTHNVSSGSGALMQTTGTAVLDPAAVASAVWGAATRTITGGLVDTATTLTNAPTVPTPSEIATQVRTELGTELGRIDATVSSRLAATDYNAPTSAPTAASVASAVWGAATRSITGGTVDTLTNAPTVPSAAAIASQVRTELSVELGRVDQSISSRLAGSAYTAPANSDIAAVKAKTDNLPASPAATGDIPSANISAIKAKTDLLNTDRLAQCSTVSTTGAQLAAALS